VVEEEPAPRKPTSKIRKALWLRDFGSTDAAGSCCKCHKDLVFKSHWEASHIVAHAKGGADTLDNLRINCRTCNRVTGTKHMDDVKMLPRKPAAAGAGTSE
jgi:5-methylcytosine-specific restriction endonuclease McrA